MEKFNIKRMYGFYWMIISLAIQLITFICFLCLLFYLKSFDSTNANQEAVKEIFSVLILIDVLIDVLFAICFIASLIIYLYRFLPFINSKGKLIHVKIIERSIGSVMYGKIETDNLNKKVKIRFVSRIFSKYFTLYQVGDYAECFVREQDLSDPKIVVLYR